MTRITGTKVLGDKARGSRERTDYIGIADLQRIEYCG